jgi:hypothetical protein
MTNGSSFFHQYIKREASFDRTTLEEKKIIEWSLGKNNRYEVNHEGFLPDPAS